MFLMLDKDYTFITFNCLTADLTELFHNGFNNGHGYLREPNSIRSAGALTAVAIQSLQNSQFGGIAVAGFDFTLAEYVKKSWKKTLIKILKQYSFFSQKKVEPEKIQWNICCYSDPSSHNRTDIGKQAVAEIVEHCDISSKDASKLYIIAAKEVAEETYQAMEALIHNLNSLHSRAANQVPFSSINFGMNTSPEGRLVIHSFLTATWNGLGNGETPIFPISIFQIKKGINYDPEDPNYDLFKLAMKVSAKRLYPNFVSLDSSFNLPYYKPDDYRTFATSMGK